MELNQHPRPQAQASLHFAVARVQAVELVDCSFALKECCGWEQDAG